MSRLGSSRAAQHSFRTGKNKQANIRQRERERARARARLGLQESMEPVALVVAVDVIKKCVSGEPSEVQRGWVKART